MVEKGDNDGSLLGRLDERTLNLSIGLKDLQREHADGKKEILAAILVHANEDDTRFKEHDTRIKVLEQWKWYILGLTAAVSAVVWVLK